MISNFDDFVKANGTPESEIVSMDTYSGQPMEFKIAGVGAKARDRIQAILYSMMDKDELAKGNAKLDINPDTLEGDSALCVSLGAINDDGERFLDNPKALKYLKENVKPKELDRIANRVKELSGIAEKSLEESEKN